jgi:hypothetical protein
MTDAHPYATVTSGSMLVLGLKSAGDVGWLQDGCFLPHFSIIQRCGVDDGEFQTKEKSYLTQHQAAVHGIGDVEVAEERMRKITKHARTHARAP